ncbi:MAG: UDP-N-acetylglucosamine--N-acetylmuramyl-(pentapeptide) pyrophosphoryl-undecaprenol N-acetylglucosamine transferase [Phycisphaerales bacterium]|nr:UDP-N-acetylglucosamine--N-acetylmuramyl-(pentapeptide) pyrophosphoryl-undecaprenol N-acetylglucosamine transferase [Phycisphaerales bacterium]
MTKKPRAYLFVGGGTGGHLYPAIAIAEQIRARQPDSLIRFVCSNRPIDAKILTDAGEDFVAIDACPMGRSFGAITRFIKGWRSSYKQSRALIYELLPTRDVIVVAMGGFVAPAPAWAAKRMRVPVVLVNLDAVPGKANLLIARFANRVCTALPVSTKRWQVLGPIVRESAKGTREQGIKAFGLDDAKQALLVTGGSQGAQSINEFMCAMVGSFPQAFDGWQIIHQTGEDESNLASVYECAGITAWVNPYIEHMGDAWGCADLTIGRCGAGTVSEAWASRVPAAFFPYPFHKDQHQKHNAMPMVNAGAAVLFEDFVDPAQNINAHGQQLAAILSSPDQLASMLGGFDAMGSTDGAGAAARLLVGF